MPWWQLHEVRSHRRATGRSVAAAWATATDNDGVSIGPIQRRRPTDQAGQEVLARRLVMAVQLPVRGDHDQRCRATGERRLLEPRHEPLAHERVRVDGRDRFEGHGRGQQTVVDDRDDGPPVAEVQADRPARVHPAAVDRFDLPWSEDRVGDPVVDQQAEGGPVDGRLGQPHAGRPATEAHLEVAQAPGDLGRAIGRRGERQDRMVERLGHPVDAAVAIDEAAVGERVAGLEPAGQRRTEVPRHRPEIAERGIGPVAIGADPLVPVARRGGGRIDRHRPGERIESRRLVEVAVDHEPGTAHDSSIARSRLVATAWWIDRDQRSPGPRWSGHDSSRPLPW